MVAGWTTTPRRPHPYGILKILPFRIIEGTSGTRYYRQGLWISVHHRGTSVHEETTIHINNFPCNEAGLIGGQE